MKNTKKTLAMAAAAAAVTGGTVLATGTAHADTVTTPANTNQTQENQQASDLKSQQDNSREAYNDAKQANTDAQSNLAQADAKNTQAQGDVQNAQNDVNTASNNVKSATTDKQNKQAAVNQAQSDAQNAQTDYNNAVTQETQNNEAAKQAQDKLNQANQEAQKAQDVADQANAKQNQAQSNADTANQNVTNTESQVNKAQGDVNNAQNDVKKAQDDVENAKNHQSVIDQDQADVQAKTDAKSKADAKVADAQKDSDEKNGAKNAASDAVKNAQKAVDDLNKGEEQSPLPTFTFTSQQKELTQSLVKELKAYYDTNPSMTSSDDISKMPSFNAWKNAMSSTGSIKVSWKDTNPNDTKTKFNLLNPRASEIQELSQWVAATLNQITKSLGIQDFVGKAVVTKGMVGEAQEVAKIASQNNQSGGGHYIYALNQAAYDYGLTQNTDNVNETTKNHQYLINSYGESAEMGILSGVNRQPVSYAEYTLADAKNEAMNAIFNMLANDRGSNMGHTTGILGMDNMMYNSKVAKGQILGVSLSGNVKDVNNEVVLYTLHIIGFPQSQVTPIESTYALNNDSMKQKIHDMGTGTVLQNPYDNSYDADKINNVTDTNIIKAKNNYNSFVAAHQNDDLQFAGWVTQSGLDYEKSKSEDSSLSQQERDDYKNWYQQDLALYNKQQKAIKPYRDAIDKAVTEAQTQLHDGYFNNDTADNAHASALAKAKQALQDAQAKLATATTEASQADAALASAKTEAQSAATALKAAQDKLANDKANSMSLENAQAELTKAQQVLAQKQANLADAKKANEQAQSMKTQSDSALTNAKSEAQAAQKALTDAKTKAKVAQDKVNELTKTSQAVANAKAKLDEANEKLQVAKSNHDQASENLAKAQDALKQAQAKLATAKDTAAQTAKDLTDAQAKADATKAALDKAKAELITDAKVYADSISIKDQTVHQNGISELTKPVIANPMAPDPTQSLVMASFLQMASSKLDTIPTGTTADWADAAQVMKDLQTAGDHTEQVLITFPDGSKTTATMTLHVLAKTPDVPVVPVNPDTPDHSGDHHDDKPSQPDTPVDPSKPTDQPSQGGQTDDHGNTPANPDVPVTPTDDSTKTNTPTDNIVVKGDGDATIAPIAKNEMPSQSVTQSNIKRSGLNNRQLPQTGNNNEAGLIALGLTTAMAMFGLTVTRRKN